MKILIKKNLIIQEKVKTKRFSKNYATQGKMSKVGISIKLNQYDFENINFISEHYEDLNNIINNYSNLDIKFYENKTNNLILNNEIYLEFEITKNGNIIILNEENLNNGLKYILFYIKHIELIQCCINVYNDVERRPDQKKFHSLKNTFAFLKSERPFLYTQVDSNPLIIDSIGNRSNNIELNNKDKFSSVSIGYDLFVIKLLKSVRERCTNLGKDFYEIGLDEKTKLIKENPIFQEFNGYLNSLLDYSLDLNICLDENIYFIFKNRRGLTCSFDKMSSGEKSLIMILFSLLGYDLSNGLFVIDEPELHLHPYMLKRLVEILKIIGKRLNMQFICATHSPLLIDEQSIHNVYKFSLNEGKTSINYPVDGIRDNESSLIHILKFENISKIFFINKIIMVEGETDEYFRKHFINYLSSLPEYTGKFDDYEILNINGKGSYKKWTRFLNKFGIKGYFIGDRDNTIENNIVAPEEMSSYIQLVKNKFSSEQINKQKFYTKIIDIIKTKFPHRYKYIHSKIQSFYKDGIYILNRGDLETYLGLEKKGLEPTINFCNSKFFYRIHDEKMAQYKNEFENIVKNIFNNNKENNEKNFS